MPLTRIDLPKGKPAEYRAELRETVYETLVQTVGVPADDRHEVVTEHDAENLYLDPNFRGLGRSPEAILIQITFNEGRTVEQKQAFYAALVESLHERLGIPPAGRDDQPHRGEEGELVVRQRRRAVRRTSLSVA
jgi:4-oxalocrotonate tautomerase